MVSVYHLSEMWVYCKKTVPDSDLVTMGTILQLFHYVFKEVQWNMKLLELWLETTLPTSPQPSMKCPPMLLSYGLCCLTDLDHTSDWHKNVTITASSNNMQWNGQKKLTTWFLVSNEAILRLWDLYMEPELPKCQEQCSLVQKNKCLAAIWTCSVKGCCHAEQMADFHTIGSQMHNFTVHLLSVHTDIRTHIQFM